MREIVKMLVIKLGKSIVWQEKVELCRFLIVGLIAFFISIELAKAKTSVFRSMKELLEILLKAQAMDKDIEAKIENVEKHLGKDSKKSS